MVDYDLKQALPLLLPKAIEWAEAVAAHAVSNGRVLTEREMEITLRVGVAQPELVRVAMVDRMPMPDDPALREAASQTGLLGLGAVGLTLGHTVFIVNGHISDRLIAHELRHVYQYEQAGSIRNFLPVYLRQIVECGYVGAPLEKDARAHEHLAF